MKKRMMGVAFGLLLGGGIALAGKNVAPAVSPVAAVEPIVPLGLFVGVGLAWDPTSTYCPCAHKRLKDSEYGGLIRIGYDFNDWIGVEARGLKSFWDEDNAETEHYGIYLKPMYHVADQVNVYALLGYGHTKIRHKFGPHGPHDHTRNGFNYGVGLEYDLGSDTPEGTYDRPFDGQGDQEGGWGLFVDYMNLMNGYGEKDIDSNVVTVGITYDF
jgi:OOP family OmpA-OmpF porin